MIKSQLSCDTGLDLLFAGMTATGHGFLHLGCREFIDGQVSSASAQENDASGVPHENGGSGSVGMGEDLLYGKSVG